MVPLLPLHPALVHLPVALAFVVPLIGIGLLFAIHRAKLPLRAWWLVVALQAVLLASGLAAARSGEQDEELVEDLVGEAPIEAHENAAQIFLIGAGLALLFSAAAPFLRKELASKRVAGASIAASFLVAGLAVQVGQAGGALVYQHGAAAAHTTAAARIAVPDQTNGELPAFAGDLEEEDEDEDEDE